jgi:histidinol-phosphate phosphatase family protein
MSNPFVIFDRDGTLIKHVHYLSEPNGVELSSNLISGLLLLKDNGFKFGIVTNQSIINRGFATVQQVESVNRRVKDLLELSGIVFEFIMYCPHTPEDMCYCRKPEPGLGLAAIKEFDIDQTSSFMVGDQHSDVIFGHAIGIQSIQVGDSVKKSLEADFNASDIFSAAEWIILKSRK